MTGFHHSPPRILDLSGFVDADAFLNGRISLLKGDCLEWLDRLPENHFDAGITDPPYHYQTIVDRFGSESAAEAQAGTDGAFKRASAGFMGKTWDGGDVAFRRETWEKVLRVLKPGAHLAAFSAPKCVHKMAYAIELAGFEVRDRIINFRDLDPAVGAFLDSLAPAQADALFSLLDHFGGLGEAFWCFGSGFPKSHNISKAIDKMLGGERPRKEAQSRKTASNAIHASGFGADGWSPQSDQAATPQAAEFDGWGTALKPAYEPIVIARKPLAKGNSIAAQVMTTGTGGINIDAARLGDGMRMRGTGKTISQNGSMSGANYSREPDGFVDGRFPSNLSHDGSDVATDGLQSRFFYTAKADANDRLGSGHPTVKPVDLMQWLCRMLCPKGGLILDPFSGTGTTGEAAYRENMSASLIEREPEYHLDIARRMELVLAGPQTRAHKSADAKAARRETQPSASNDQSDDLLGALGHAAPPRDAKRQVYGKFADEGKARRLK